MVCFQTSFRSFNQYGELSFGMYQAVWEGRGLNYLPVLQSDSKILNIFRYAYVQTPGSIISDFLGSSRSGTNTRKPNIILIFADDLGYKDLGMNGSDFYETPHIDHLAKEGMQFQNAYSSAANCAPSRAGLLSGQYNPRHGVFAVGTTEKGPVNQMRLKPVPNTTFLAPSFVTIAEVLKSTGYATGQFGKWHIGSEKKKNTDPGSQGFDTYMEPDAPWGNNKITATEDPKGAFGITRAAMNFIEQNQRKPFFAYVSHHAVHGPHQARPASLEKFKAKKPGKLHNNPLYAACIYDLDASVGQIMTQLKKLGLEKNTLVIFTSDNGGAPVSSQEPLRGNKGSFYEGGIREAFIARWPGKIKAGSLSLAPIINIDLYPTFAAAAGIKLPAKQVIDGENLMPVFTGQKSMTSRDELFWHFPGYLAGTVIRGRNPQWRTQPVSVIRKGDHKLFLYHEEWQLDGGWDKRTAGKGIELYNLKTDNGEHQNIAASNPAKRDELLKTLLAWIERTKAPMATVMTPEQAAMRKMPAGKKRAKAVEDDEN